MGFDASTRSTLNGLRLARRLRCSTDFDATDFDATGFDAMGSMLDGLRCSTGSMLDGLRRDGLRSTGSMLDGLRCSTGFDARRAPMLDGLRCFGSLDGLDARRASMLDGLRCSTGFDATGFDATGFDASTRSRLRLARGFRPTRGFRRRFDVSTRSRLPIVYRHAVKPSPGSSSNVAVVTGAGRGLGRAIAERLARKGYHVVATDIDEVAARATATLVGGTSARHDVRDPDAHRAIAQLAAQRGTVTLWVNNAGVLAVGDSWTLDDAAVRRQIDVNILGVIWGCHAALSVMEQGTILNIASLSALTATPGLAVYGATKHAVLGYSLSLASELRQAKRPIHVGALLPDAIKGDMTDAVAHDAAAGLLFSNAKLLSLDTVADAAIAQIENAQLVKSIPRVRAALAHLARPFPSLGLPILERFVRAGRKRQG
jgi:short-subunit dehydrogenase